MDGFPVLGQGQQSHSWRRIIAHGIYSKNMCHVAVTTQLYCLVRDIHVRILLPETYNKNIRNEFCMCWVINVKMMCACVRDSPLEINTQNQTSSDPFSHAETTI